MTRRSTPSRWSAAASARCRRCWCSPSAAARPHPATGCTRSWARSAPTTRWSSTWCRCRRAPSRRWPATTRSGVYAASGGNPFYVTEMLASRSADELPASIANAVVGRASRLDDASRRLVELVSVVPSRTRTSLLDAVMPGWTAAAIEPERRQLLQFESSYVRFRHELARHAIRSSVPIAARRRLHAEIVEALLAIDADPADIVHHAEAAGANDVVASHALVAARRAAAMGSNAEAHSHYLRAGDFADRRPLPEQAIVLEELAVAAYLAGRVDHSIPAIERAMAINAELGDVGVGGPLQADPVAAALVRGQRRRGPPDRAGGGRAPRTAGRVGRAGAGLQRALADGDAGRGRRFDDPVGQAGAGARRAARRRPRARARAGQHRLRAHADGLRRGPGAAARGVPHRRSRGRPARGRRARSSTCRTP